MRYLLVLLSTLLLTGCFDRRDYLSDRARLCHRQGYGGMLVQVQTARDNDGEKTGGYTITTSCGGPQSGLDAVPVVPHQPKVYDT